MAREGSGDTAARIDHSHCLERFRFVNMASMVRVFNAMLKNDDIGEARKAPLVRVFNAAQESNRRRFSRRFPVSFALTVAFPIGPSLSRVPVSPSARAIIFHHRVPARADETISTLIQISCYGELQLSGLIPLGNADKAVKKLL
jgi:hypothetical protein